MKARERQDLKKNELADVLENINRFFTLHGSKVLAVAVLILVIISAAAYFAHTGKVARAQAWEQLLSIRSSNVRSTAATDDLRTLAQQTSDRNVAAFAWKELGDLLVLENTLGPQKENKTDWAAQAEQAYQTVVDKYKDQPIPYGGAQMGLAALYEDLGKWDQARKIYTQIGEDKILTGTGIPALAKARLADLGKYEEAAKTPLATTQPTTKPTTKPAAQG